jgi:hypothetical protein
MSIERIVGTCDAGPLVAGLVWRPPAGGKPSRKALAEARALVDASHYALVRNGEHAVYGLFALRPSEEGEKLPKAAISVAALFAQHVGRDTPNAALLAALPDGDRGQERKHCLVVLEDGLPSIDMIGEASSVLKALGDEPRPVWSDGLARFAHAEWASLQGLADLARQGVHKSARIQRVPINPLPVVAAATAAALLVGLTHAWKQHKLAEHKREAEEAAAAADPAPKYLALLGARRPTMLARRDQVASVVRTLFDLRAFPSGWQLRAVECAAQTSTCSATWQRRGGTYEELQRAVSSQELVVDAGQVAAAPNLDLAVTRWPIAVGRQAAAEKLPTYEGALAGAGGVFQQWKTADMTVDLKLPTLWPQSAEVPAGFTHPRALRRGEISVKEVPAPFVMEALQAAPAWVSWESVRLDVGDLVPGAARGQLRFTLSGNYYVATQ